MRYLLLLHTLLLSVGLAQTPKLTIDDIIELSLKHSPDIKIAKLDFEGAKMRTKALQGGYLPRVDLALYGGKQHNKRTNQSSTQSDILQGQLTASQLLYDFGKTQGAIEASSASTRAFEAQMKQSISDKIFLLKQAYYNLLKAQSIIDVQRKNLTLQEQHLKRTQRYLDSGIKTIIDVTDAQVQLEKAQLDLNNANYDLEIKRTLLESEMGYTPHDGAYRLHYTPLPKHLSQSIPPVHNSLQELEAYAYAHRPLLDASRHTITQADANLERIRGDYYPTLRLNGAYSQQEVDESMVALTPKAQGSLTVAMEWNLFSGYQTSANEEEAKIARLQASSAQEDIKIAIRQDLFESHILLRQRKEGLKLSESISHASFKKFEQAQKRYNNELSDFIELQNAQQEYIEALSNSANAYYDYFIALAKLDHAIGK
jgi:outer membrane protein